MGERERSAAPSGVKPLFHRCEEGKSGLRIIRCERFDGKVWSGALTPFSRPPPEVLYRVTDYGGLGLARTDNYER